MKHMSFSEFCQKMEQYNMVPGDKEPLKGVVVFQEVSFNVHYSETSRSYSVSSRAKYFNAEMGGSSLFGSCLDGSDSCVRLDWYMYGEKPWLVDYCYFTSEFKKGDKVKVAKNGKVICEGTVLSKEVRFTDYCVVYDISYLKDGREWILCQVPVENIVKQVEHK